MNKKLVYILLIVLILSPGCGKSENYKCTKIDITGNWQDENGFLPYIQTNEPALKKGELKSFFQELVLGRGKYSILFEYNQIDDRIHGTFENDSMVFNGFKVDGKVTKLLFSADPADKSESGIWRAESEINVDTLKTIKLALAIRNTRVMRTWFTGSSFPLNNKRYSAVDPGEPGEHLLIRGIPFLARKTNIRHDVPWYSVTEPSLGADRGSLKKWDNGMNFNLGGTKVSKLHFLGMIHQVDIANGSWYCLKTDYGYSHFVGDKAGEIIITSENNEKSVIPLIFGFNMWYSRPWDVFWCYILSVPDPMSAGYNYDSTIFCGEQSYRDLIRNSVALTDGMRLMGSGSNNTRFIFSLDLKNKPVRSVEIKGVEGLHGIPLISAITVEGDEPSTVLSTLPELSRSESHIKPVTTEYIRNGEYRPDMEKLKHILYTYREEMPEISEPEIPEGYFGPGYNFKGTREAVYAATCLYRNGPECGAKIADNGTGCESSIAQKQIVHYTMGIGIWRKVPSVYGNLQNWFRIYRTKSPGENPGTGSAWSRGIGELMRESMAFGYTKFINKYTIWLDSCLLSEATPPHWTRIVGSGNKYEGNETRKVGKITETGNRENDGHGICMWGRYMVYHWLGHSRAWNELHWEATKAAVNWIRWQLDTDTIFPGKRKDVLYTESECGNYEFYASCNCLHGIRLAIRMAKELGKDQEARSWTLLYNRLQQGLLDNTVDSGGFGPVWHTEPEKNWRDDGQKMVHIQLAPDGITYTPLQDYAKADSITQKYLKIDINSYHFLMRDRNYNFLRSYGYGQGMMTQAALLLDEMNDAGKFIDMMVDHCYLPRLEGWTAPEGIILHENGEYWVAVNGYLGQDSHLADSQKALRLMLGIDDNNPEQLRIIPRYPSSWNQMSITDFPVLTGYKRQKISYMYAREEKRQIFEYHINSPVKDMSLRLGPLPEGKDISEALSDGKKVQFEKLSSGDSRWIWIRHLYGIKGKIEIIYK